MTKTEIIFGKHKKEYTLIRKKRSTISVTVKPDLRIIVSCPIHATNEKIETFLRKKWRWIDEQVAFFKKYQKKIYKKEYVSGESFYYLGRQYQLVIKKAEEDNISLTRDQLIVHSVKGSSHKAYTKQLVTMWYKQKAKVILVKYFAEQLERFGYKKKILLRIASMKRKWGSFRGSTVTLNPLLVQARKEAIDYVITHELCHIRYQNHSKKFWEYMDEMYPGWEKEKERLERQFG